MYEERLKHYLDDLSLDVNLIDEAIASLEKHFELTSDNELLHNSRACAIAYLALKKIVQCKDCWRRDSYGCPLHEGGYPDHDTADDWFCGDGEKEPK